MEFFGIKIFIVYFLIGVLVFVVYFFGVFMKKLLERVNWIFFKIFFKFYFKLEWNILKDGYFVFVVLNR